MLYNIRRKLTGGAEMDNVSSWVPIIIVILAVAAAGAAAAVIRGKIRRFSKTAFGTDSLAEGIKLQRDILAENPKSVSSMTKLFLPQISEDFPELNCSRLKTRAENALLSAFAALNDGKVREIEGVTDDFINQIKLRIEDNDAAGITERFSETEIHDTQINDYRKGAGMCKIVFQSAVGYKYQKEKDGKLICGKDGLCTQTKYNVEAVYIQNPEIVEKMSGNAVGTVCPNCGAPVTSVGEKKCQYCGSAVEAVNIKTWLINSFKEV